jgi:hypothetical protein
VCFYFMFDDVGIALKMRVFERSGEGIAGLLDYWIVGLLDCWIAGLLDCCIAAACYGGRGSAAASPSWRLSSFRQPGFNRGPDLNAETQRGGAATKVIAAREPKTDFFREGSANSGW